MARIVVVGGGIAGLSTALRLLQDGRHQVQVLEATDRVGGLLRSAEVAGALVDVGAESMLWRRPEAKELFATLGLRPVHPAGVSASVWSRGGLRPMPARTLMGIPSDPARLAPLLTAQEIARVRAEQPSPVHGDLSIGDLVQDRLGAAVVDRLVEPLLGGVYAGQARLLSAQACVPAAHAAAVRGESLLQAVAAAMPPAPVAGSSQAAEPVFASVPGGVGTLPGVLTARLEQGGVSVHTGMTVRALRQQPGGWSLSIGDPRSPRELHADAVVLAVPAASAARLLRECAPQASALLDQIEYASLALVTLAFRRDRLPAGLADSSGFLVPPVEGRAIKAATFSSAKWPWLAERDPDLVFVRLSFGRHREAAALQRSDAEMIEAGLADLESALGTRLPQPVDAHVQRWGGGLPQYLVGHQQRIAAIRAEVHRHRGLSVAGALYDGVGIPGCLVSGHRAAEAVLAQDLPTGADADPVRHHDGQGR